jgi:hypothetical protein
MAHLDHRWMTHGDARDVIQRQRLLVVLKPYVGTPPNRRSVTSMQAITVGSVLSRMGSTTRYLLQASQAHHKHVFRPSTSGPSA